MTKSEATFSWNELLECSGGEAVSHHRHFDPAPLETDTRTLTAGSFFLPLSGANFDGNGFIEQAYQAGAEGAFVAQNYLQGHPDLKRFPNLIQVADPNQTYCDLALYHRHRMTAKIVAITGSSGKTTTKEMLYQLLSFVGVVVQRSEKNFNNEVGVPMTMLNLKPDTQVLVLEMGMRGLGQIELLSHTAEPDIAIISNVGPAHIGILGSMEAIVEAKSEICKGMDPETGVLVVNGDDPLLVNTVGRIWSGHTEPFSLHEVENIHTLENGKITFDFEGVTFTLGLPGSHNVMNALSCIKTALQLGVPLKYMANALAEFQPVGERWNRFQLEGADNLWVINDAYNSNPASLKVSLGAFMDLKLPEFTKVAVIGPMNELGAFSEKYHREVGEWINTKGKIDGLIVVGREAQALYDAILDDSIPRHLVDDNAQAAQVMLEVWPRNTVFFLKASRASQFEEIPQLIQSKVGNALSS